MPDRAGPEKGRKPYPDRVHFTTWTLKYSGCDWVEVLGLDRHYDRAVVDAKRTETGYHVATANVRSLRLILKDGDEAPQIVLIDGQELSVTPARSAAGALAVYLERRNGKWHGVLPAKIAVDRLRRPQKVSGLQGPIDDAFTDSFLCVRGSGVAWNPEIATSANANLKRFEAEWEKYFRGKLPVKNDNEVTDEDIATRHLILFGDPASNSLIAHVLEGLPLTWTKDSIAFAGKTYDAATHVPALVYPSPLNVNRYVVLNSGHTFHARDFAGTNALLYPRLGDYAILKPAPTAGDPAAAEVVTAGLFDDSWKLPGK